MTLQILWKKVIASIDGNASLVVDGFSNGETWNGWDVVALTLSGMVAWLKSSGYEYALVKDNDGIPGIWVDFPDGAETIWSSPLFYTDQDGTDVHEVYFMDGYCFKIVEEVKQGLT